MYCGYSHGRFESERSLSHCITSKCSKNKFRPQYFGPSDLTWNVKTFKYSKGLMHLSDTSWYLTEISLEKFHYQHFIMKKHLESSLSFCHFFFPLSCSIHILCKAPLSSKKKTGKHIFLLSHNHLIVFLINSTAWNKLLTYQTLLFSVTASAVNRPLTIHNEQDMFVSSMC